MSVSDQSPETPGALPYETAGERAARTESGRFRPVALIAAVVCLVAAIGEVTTLMASIAKIRSIGDALGSPLPGPAGLIVQLNPVALGIVVLSVATALYLLFAFLARRYWIGLLFVPLFLYGILGGELSNWLALASLAAIQNIK